MNLLQVINVGAGSSTASWKDWLPVAAFAFTIFIFIYDRRKAVKLRKIETVRNWYLKVIVEPNTKVLHIFFYDVEKLCVDAFQELSVVKPKLTVDEFRKECQAWYLRHRKLREQLESEFMFALRYQFDDIATAIDDKLDIIYDRYTQTIDRADFSDTPMNVHLYSLKKSKMDVFEELYKGISSKYLESKISES